MTLDRTRPAWLLYRAAVPALVFVSSLAVAPGGVARAAAGGGGVADGMADGPADWPAFVAQPSNPAPPFPLELLTQFSAKGQLPAVPMPQDRAVDSYRIYSVLMPVGELARPGWSRVLWLLSDTTVSLVAPDRPCMGQDESGPTMNPHEAVEAPADRRQDLSEMLEDFDRRCHERLQLTPEAFTLVVPLRLLSAAEQDEFVRTRFDPYAGAEGDALTAKYRGAPGISRFSEVYFNSHHTVAMVYASGWCGGVCAQSYWEVLALQDGSWKRLGWRTASRMN